MSEVTITTYEGDTITAESVGTTVTVIEGGVGGPGPAGPQGLQGDPGPAGPQGDPGDQGPAGPAGATGAAGPQGSQGAKGDLGDVGPAGASGPAGADGAQGPAGPVGPKGDTGDVGPTGPTGLKGDTGATGAQGIQGVKGDTGATGATGPAGPAGVDGNTDGRLGLNLTKQGVVLAKGTTGAWDADMVEGPFVFNDPKSGKLAMLYVGYGTTSGAQRAGIGLAYSTDGITWTKQGSAAILPHSGTSGAADENGCSGPTVYWDNDNARYVLYYIGLTATGYEAGTKRICWATATSLTGPWTRQGAAITPSGSGWRQQAVWHRSIVKRGATYYMFFNASNASGVESIGYATAPGLSGPWTVDDANSPVVSAGTGWEAQYVGDPCVRRIGDMWVMDYYGVTSGFTAASDGLAVTPDSSFPLGWTKYAGNPILTPGASYDAKFAHKPFVVERGGVLYHYYTAVSASDVRQIALATEGLPPSSSLTVQDENGVVATGVTQIDFQGAGVTASSGTGEVVVTVPGATSSGSSFTPKVKQVRYTTAILKVASTTFVAPVLNSDGSSIGSALDLVFPSGSVAAGDMIEVGGNLVWGNAAVDGYISFGSIVAGSIVNVFLDEKGIPGLWGISGAYVNASGSGFYTVQAADLSSGALTIRPLTRGTSTGPKQLLAGGASPNKDSIIMWAKNWGPQ